MHPQRAWVKLITDRSTLGYGVLIAALVAGTSLRVTGLAGKNALTHDETISYLVATGHKAEYSKVLEEERPPYGLWAAADEWKRFMRIEDVLCFGKIRHDLATTDLHPPLYFWLLHIWCLLFGVNVWTGPTLNLLLTSAVTLALFGIARFVLRDSLKGAFVAFAWSVSPTVIPIALVARHYDLLALATVLFVWQVIRCADPAAPLRHRSSLWLTMATAFGLLTHYHFLLTVAGCGLFVVVRLIKRHRRRLLTMCAAVFVGFLIFVVLNPGFYSSIQTGRGRAQAFGSEPVSQRVDRTVARYTAFFVDSMSMPVSDHKAVQHAVLGGLIALSLIVAGRGAWRRLTSRQASPQTGIAGLYILYFFLWTAGTNILLYLTFVSPKHAMEPKYPTMAWPFFAFVPVVLLGTFRKTGTVLTIVLCLGMLAAGGQKTSRLSAYNRRIEAPTALFERAQQVLVDNVERGVLPRALWHCPDDMSVFAARPAYLLDRKDAWFDQLVDDTLYVSPPGRGDSNQKRKILVRSIAEAYTITRIKGWFWNLGPSFWITPQD